MKKVNILGSVTANFLIVGGLFVGDANTLMLEVGGAALGTTIGAKQQVDVVAATIESGPIAELNGLVITGANLEKLPGLRAKMHAATGRDPAVILQKYFRVSSMASST